MLRVYIEKVVNTESYNFLPRILATIARDDIREWEDTQQKILLIYKNNKNGLKYQFLGLCMQYEHDHSRG